MNDLKFKILEVRQNPDVATIKAQCTKDGEVVTSGIPTLFIADRSFIKGALKQSYLRQLENELEPGEII